MQFAFDIFQYLDPCREQEENSDKVGQEWRLAWPAAEVALLCEAPWDCHH